jgi:magnesium transporter
VDDAIEVYKDEATEDLLALSGVTREERVHTGALRSIRLRAPWLLVNLGTAFLASYVVSRFEGQIRILPALAVLMPIVAGLGGNSATQTLAVVIRGMALGELTSFSRAAVKALLVGLANGCMIGLIAAAATAAFYDNYRLGLVLAGAMAINMLVAGLTGTLVPLGLRLLRIDPAIASSVFVTFATDAAGFLSFLGIATILMNILKSG